MPVWKAQYPGVEGLNVAVMGCIVNGPGESKHADIGISLPGTGETPAAPVFIDGAKADDAARRRDRATNSRRWSMDYVERRFGAHGRRRNSRNMYEPPLHRQEDLAAAARADPRTSARPARSARGRAACSPTRFRS